MISEDSGNITIYGAYSMIKNGNWIIRSGPRWDEFGIIWSFWINARETFILHSTFWDITK